MNVLLAIKFKNNFLSFQEANSVRMATSRSRDDVTGYDFEL